MRLMMVRLAPDALDYLRSYLIEKGDTFSQYVANRRLREGLVFAFLPSDADVGRRCDYYANVFEDPDQVDAARDWAVDFVGAFLHCTDHGIAIFETYFDMADAEKIKLPGPFFSYRPTRYATWDGKASFSHTAGLCLYVKSEHVAAYNLQYLAVGVGRPDHGFLCGLPAGMAEQIQPGAELENTVMEDLASRVQHVIAPIFDGDTYMIWSAAEE